MFLAPRRRFRNCHRILDVMQYLVSAFCLRFWIYHEEGKQWKETQSIDGEYNKPKWIDRPAFTFFIAKIICLVLTYIFIFIHICKIIYLHMCTYPRDNRVQIAL